ncbi:hypothetical protein Tco_0606593 [Tanacetum coccineum]
MMNSKGFFFFKFDTSKGLEDDIENGPGMICVLTNDGISLIATKIGKPIMLDYYFSSICIDSWGRSNLARCLIKVKVDDVLKESVTMGIPLLMALIFLRRRRWFLNGGYKRRNGKIGSNNNSTNRSGVKIGGQSVKLNFRYVPKASISVPQTGAPNNGKNGGSKAKEKVSFPYNSSNIPTSNPYELLDEDSEEEFENVFDEYLNLLSGPKQGQALLNIWFLMFSVASWNRRGLKRSSKQKEVHQVEMACNESLCITPLKYCSGKVTGA